ncbi:Uncharacterised protein [uncultured Eubacterium sp.]|uniref:DUF3870 domain-containing protein n=1 Tax=Emergencia sp. TaxID=1926557 RepID=UPI0008234923|nr:Uncharacterised protein [uncultured Eubacterium sp.]
MYDENTVYVIGHGKTSCDNAITSRFNIFFIGFVVDTRDDRIVDLECTATIDITNRFVKDIFSGGTLGRYDEKLIETVKRRYFGSSQKAIITAYKDAVKKYQLVKEEYYL